MDSNAQKNNKISTEEIKWIKVNKLINKEIKTIKSIGKLGPRLQYRLFELYSERIKLIRIKENKSFMKASPRLIQQNGKKSFYVKSRKQFQITKKYGLKIIGKYSNFINNSDIYYTLAINSRDYNNHKRTEKYLLLSLKNAPANSPIIHLIRTSLAEYYYNEKKYHKAIYNYKHVLSNKDDEWKSKHSYNNAWCLFKVKKHDKAINMLKSAFSLSKSKRYIDVKDQVFETIGVFHIHANRASEAVDFYLKESKNPTEFLIKMGKKASEHLGYEKTNSVFTAALSNAKKRKNISDEMKVYLAQLEFYRTFKKENEYFLVSKAIQKLNTSKKIDEELINQAITEIKSKVGFLQVNFAKAIKINSHNYNTAKLNRIIAYFSILKSIDTTKRAEYTYFQGETFYIAKEYSKASKAYAKSLIYSYKKKDNKILQKKIINSLLALLEVSNFKASKKYKLTIFTYKHHLKLWPIDLTSQKIYPKYFNLLMTKKKSTSAYKILIKYNKYYPSDLKIQKSLFTTLFDYDVKRKDKKKVTAWIAKLQKGFLSFNQKYIEKSILILSQILFNELSQLKKLGKSKQVLSGYESIYNNKDYPNKIKAQAALEIGSLYIRKSNTEESFTWIKESIKKSTIKEFLYKKDLYLELSSLYILLQSFSKAAAINKTIITKQCKHKKLIDNNTILNYIQYSLISKATNKVIAQINSLKACEIREKVYKEAQLLIVNHLYKNNKVKQLKVLLESSKWVEHKNILSKNIFELEVNKRENKESRPLIIAMNKSYRNLKFKVLDTGKEFNDKTLNSLIEDNLKLLNNFENSQTVNLQSKNPQVSLRAHRLVAKAYKRVANSIINYNPKGLPKKFKKALKSQLRPLANNIAAQSNTLINNTRLSIEKRKYLSKANRYVTMDAKLLENINFLYPASKLTSTIDFPGGL
jgi:hypothetical protein